MDMEAKAQALREAVEGGASNSDLMQMLAEIQAAERERCAKLETAIQEALKQYEEKQSASDTRITGEMPDELHIFSYLQGREDALAHLPPDQRPSISE